MKITRIKNGKIVGAPVENNAKSLLDITSEKLSEHSLANLLDKKSETYDVVLDKSLDDDFFTGIKGLTWRAVLDNENADFTLYGLPLKKVYYQIEQKNANSYSLKTNGKEVLLIEFEKQTEIKDKPFDKNALILDEKALKQPVNDRIVADYVIAGEFYQCIMCTRDLYESLVKEVLGCNWKTDYSQILNDHIKKTKQNNEAQNMNPKEFNVEFSNFWRFNEMKKNEIDEKKCEGVSDHIKNMGYIFKEFRNCTAHNLGEIADKNKVSLVNAIENMISIAKILENDSVNRFLSQKKSRIEELFKC